MNSRITGIACTTVQVTASRMAYPCPSSPHCMRRRNRKRCARSDRQPGECQHRTKIVAKRKISAGRNRGGFALFSRPRQLKSGRREVSDLSFLPGSGAPVCGSSPRVSRAEKPVSNFCFQLAFRVRRRRRRGYPVCTPHTNVIRLLATLALAFPLRSIAQRPLTPANGQ